MPTIYFLLHVQRFHACAHYIGLHYSNFKLTNQVARNKGSIFHSHLVSRTLVPGSVDTLVASRLNGHCPISFSAAI